MSLVGKKAPIFNAPAVLNGHEIVDSFSLEQYIGKKEVLFFFYPKDFTFVCPTELFAFQAKLEEFEKRGVAVVGCSVDTPEVHLAWLSTAKNKGGIEGVKYPLVADGHKTIAHNFGVLDGEWAYNENEELTFEGGAGVAFRGTFYIDKEGIVRHVNINDLPIGRNIDESLRVIDAWQHHLVHGDVCPANWEAGQDTLMESPESVANYLANH